MKGPTTDNRGMYFRMPQKTAGPHDWVSTEKGTRQRAGTCLGEQEGMQKRV